MHRLLIGLILMLSLSAVSIAEARIRPYELIVPKENQHKIVPAIHNVMKDQDFELVQEVCTLDNCSSGVGISFVRYTQKPCGFCFYPFKALYFNLHEDAQNTKLVIKMYQDFDGKHIDFTGGLLYNKFLTELLKGIHEKTGGQMMLEKDKKEIEGKNHD
ncbi:MAG: hypothetical protein VKJ04_01990 [Vampirovibrionales bacterium]|nr:hypothetical protein [Vampirovibrionales bacterium]